jgi:putative ABC transport system substrate-binding protein
MRRRNFIKLLGGVVAWPLAAHAQQAARMRRIGILLNASSDDPQYQAWVGAFLQELALLGWAIGRSVQIPPNPLASSTQSRPRRRRCGWR